MAENPYEAPTTQIAIEQSFWKNDERSYGRAGVRWLVICSLAAAPSFVIAVAMIGGRGVGPIAGMICGILSFVVLYTYVECLPKIHNRLKTDIAFRRAVKIGYGTRIVMSVLFPVGFYLDLLVGAMAIGISNSFGAWGVAIDRSITSEGVHPTFVQEFFSFLTTTVIQGLLLNGILMVYMLLIYGIGVLFRKKTPSYP